MALDSRPTRQLTSREVCKMLGGAAGGLLDMCDPEDLADAFNHFHEHAGEYLAMWRAVKEQTEKLKKQYPPHL